MKDFVSFETAKKLKAAGFDYPCSYYYTSYDGLKGNIQESCNGDGNFNAIITDLCAIKCSAPMLWQAQKWLRVKKKINVLIRDCACGYHWEVSKAGDEQTRGTMLIYYDGNGEDECSGMWLSYEAALSAGIDEALNLIIKHKE